MNDVTICIKSFERQNSVNRLLSQLRQADLGARILVADDSERPLDIQGADKVIRLPFDVGLSAGRNALVAEVDTPYFVIMDDDNVIYNRTNFGLMHKTIKETSFNIVGGQMRRTVFFGVVELEGQTVHQYHYGWRGVSEGHKVVDYCDNFFMAETEVVRNNPWDERIKITWEHIDFFMQGKQTGDFKVCRVASFTGDNKLCESKEHQERYAKFRGRDQEFRDIFDAKWGVHKFEQHWEKRLMEKHDLRLGA